MVTDFYKAGMTYKDFIKHLSKTHYPMDDLVPRYENYRPLFLGDVMGWGTKEGPSHQRKFFKDRQPHFQFWTKEYLDGLAKYIKENFPECIGLEVGAGNGDLTRELRKRGVAIISSNKKANNEDYGGITYKTDYIMDYKDALKMMDEIKRPYFIISSWMPLYEDWTPAFREADYSVGYILIGEVEAACGSSETFIEAPGWALDHKVHKFDSFNICRSDMIDFSKNVPKSFSMMDRGHSSTMVYKRVAEIGAWKNMAFKASRIAFNLWENIKRIISLDYKIWALRKRLIKKLDSLWGKKRVKRTEKLDKLFDNLLETSGSLKKLKISGMTRQERWIRFKRFFNQQVY